MAHRERRRLAGAGVGLVVSLIVAVQPSQAARTVYFADPTAGAIAQFGVLAGGALSPLDPASAPGQGARRLAMTPDGESLYAAGDGAVSQYDVATDGALTPKAPAALAVSGEPHSIAVSPDGTSVYVSDYDKGTLRQYAIGAGGALKPRDPATLPVGKRPRGVAISPDGASVYVLAKSAIVRFAVAEDGALTPGPAISTVGYELEDVVLTPDGRNLYATAANGLVFAFDVGANGALSPKAPATVAVEGCPIGIAVSPDGIAAFVATNDGEGPRVLAFTIGADGALTPADLPETAVASSRLWYLAASPDGRSLYAAGGDGFLFDVGPIAALSAKEPATVNLDGAVGVVVSPNQSPVARFEAAPAAAGEPLAFDASSATDSDGTIVRYDWNFGDGTTLLDGGPQPRHTYTAPGTYTVVLTVVDNEGASTATVFTGGTVLGRGTPGARTSRAIEVPAAVIAAPPVPDAPPPPVEAAQRPVPDLGETLVAQPVSGTVRVRAPGSSRFVALRSVRELALGSTIDARKGRVSVETVRKRRGRIQDGTFSKGVFAVRQRKAEKYVTELVLRGALPRCGAERAQASAKKGKRKLWGDADGRFRTRGRYSSGTVRGTKWLVEDRCDGTLTVVRRGEVAVRDFVRDETVVLDAGERYLARP